MVTVYYALVFISGCFIGSFLNLIADRVVKGGSIIFGRSKCDFCGIYLRPLSLIPIFSFLFQKGKCVSCGGKLSWYYPISEILTGLMFLLAAIYSRVFVDFWYGSILLFIYLMIVFSFYIIMFFTDIKYMIIPDGVVYAAIIFVFSLLVISMAASIFGMYHDILNNPLGKYLFQAGYFKNQVVYMLKHFIILVGSSFSISLFFIFLILLTKGRGMGGGDVKLGLLIGLFNGFPNNILGIFLSFVIGSVFSLILILFGKKTVKDTIPFGPFLIVGSLVAFFFGSRILNWYLGIPW